LSKRIIVIFVIILLIIAALVYVFPIASTVYADMKAYETRVAYRNNYQLHTTPLSTETVNDLCSKLLVSESSEHCKPTAVVYAPDLFDEIKAYFRSLPDNHQNHKTVEVILGPYLTFCETPYPDGSYVCHYDIRGDRVYPIAFFFDKEGFYYRIIANIGGS
jgi:hypothetical protein